MIIMFFNLIKAAKRTEIQLVKLQEIKVRMLRIL